MVSISRAGLSEKLCADCSRGRAAECEPANSAGASKRNEAWENPLGESRLPKTFGRRLNLILERDDFSSNRHPALSFCLSMIFSENGTHFSGSCSSCCFGRAVACSDDVVSLDPSGRADGERVFARDASSRAVLLSPRRKAAAPTPDRPARISLSAIGHRELGIAERSLGLSCHRRTQNRNCFFRIGFIISCQRAPAQVTSR